MARVRIYNYTFIPGAANNTKVILAGKIDISNILVITNVTRNEILYNFADTSRGSVSVVYTSPSEAGVSPATVPGLQSTEGYTTITLKFDTSSYSAGDKLTIYAEEVSSAVRMLPAETYVDPANKMRISQPQSLIDTDFELGLQPTKWEFLQGHNNIPSYYVRPSDSPLTPLLGGMGYALFSRTISVSSNIATISGLTLPTAPAEGSFVYIVEQNNLANFTNVRFSVLPGATTSQVQFYSSAANGSYTASCVVFGGVAPTQASFGAGSFVVIGVSNDISPAGANLVANSPVSVLETLNETYADGTFFLQGSNTASRSFFYKAKSLFAVQNDLVKLGSTTVYSGQIFNSAVIGSNLKTFSVTSLGSETNGRTVIVNCLQGHGLYPGAPIFVSNLVANGVNANGSYYVASCPTEFQFIYYVPAPITAAAATTGATNAITIAGSNILRFASAPTAPIGASVTGTNIPPGAFVVGTFDSGRAVRLNIPVVTQVASATTISFSQVISQPTTQIFVRPEGNQLHRSTDGGVQITPGTNNLFDYALRQTRRYFRYQSGKGIQFSTASLFKPSYDITGISVSGSTATITTDQDHGLQPGATVNISGVVSSVNSENALFNRNHVVLGTPALTSKTFTISLTGSPTDQNPGGDAQVTVGLSSGSTTRLGLFDDTNGMFWEFDGQSFSAVRRNSTTVLRGTINILTGSSLFTGINTRFTKQLSQGDKIVIRGQVYVVKSVTSDVSVHVAPFYRAATPSTNLGNTGAPYSQITTYTGQAAGGGQVAWINMSASTTLSQVSTTSAGGGTTGTYQFNVSSATNIVAGQHISGTGIPAGTYVSSIIGNVVTITNPLSSTASGTYIFGAVPGASAGTEQPASVIALASSANISPGMTIVGTGIPSNTTVVSVSANSIVVTPAVTSAVANGTAITFVGNSQSISSLLRINTANITAGATTIQFSSANPGLSDVRTGLQIAGSVGISPGTFITAWNPTTNTATLSAPVGEQIGPASAVNVTNTTVTTNLLTTSAAHGLAPGQAIFLSGTAFGGLITNRYYFVTSTPAANTLTISTVPGGTNATLATASGTMALTPSLIVGSRVFVNNANNVAFNDARAVMLQSKEVRVACTNTTVTTNIVTCASTASLYEGMPVTFTGTTFGNVAQNTIYYIRDILSATTFTLNSTPTSGIFALTTASGTMILQSTAVGYELEQTITGGTYHTSNVTRVFSEDFAVRATKVVDLRIPSTQFNLDRLDGSGPSNYTIDTNKIQMVFIDYTWYGAGFVRWGLRAKDGDVIYAHKMQHNNNEVQAYLRSGNLPGRFEVANNPKESKLTTAITTSGYTTASPGNIDVVSAQNFFVPVGTVSHGEVLIDGEYFSYSDVTSVATNSSPWYTGASSPVLATATCTVSNGKIATVSITAAGAQYTNEPPVMLKGGGGFGAQLKAILNNGSIAEIEILNPGSGYTSAPTIVIGPNRLTGCVREASYVSATSGVTTASTTVGSNIITVPSNSNWKVGQIIAPPITQFNFITPLKVTGIASATSIYVDQPATTAGSGNVSLPVTRRGTIESPHTIYSSNTQASTVYCTVQNCTPTMQHWGVSVIMDGRFDTDKSYVFTTPRSTASVIRPASTAPILSIRISPSVEASIARNFGIRNVLNRMQLILNSLGIYNQGAFLISIRLNATSTTFSPANWQANAVGSGSLSQVIYHNPGDVIIGGDVIYALYASAAGGNNFTTTTADLTRVKDLGHSIIGGDGVYPDGPDVITVTATNLSSTTTGVLFARLSWEEAQA